MSLDVVSLVGVYHADGGPLGEAKYILGKLLGTAHCALCDITHSPLRRKPAWDAMVARLGVPFDLLHLNEMPADVAAAVAAAGSPVVLVRLSDGSLQQLLGAADLDRLRGSVTDFERAILDGVGQMGGRITEDGWDDAAAPGATPWGSPSSTRSSPPR